MHREYTGCSYMSTCGVWRQETTHTKKGIAKKKNTQTVNVEAFAKKHLSKNALEGRTDALFAAYSSYAERGGRPYWLLKVLASSQLQKKGAWTPDTTPSTGRGSSEAWQRWQVC